MDAGVRGPAADTVEIGKVALYEPDHKSTGSCVERFLACPLNPLNEPVDPFTQVSLQKIPLGEAIGRRVLSAF